MVIREDDGKTGDESVFFLFIVGDGERVVRERVACCYGESTCF